MQPLLIILCGLPFSGKSTLAKSLSDTLNLPVLSYDNDIYAVYKNSVPAGTSNAKEYEFVQAIARKKLQEILTKGQSVIYDDLCLEKSDRQLFIDLAHKCNTNYLVVFADTPLNVIEQRRIGNLENKQRDHIDEAKLQHDLALFEPPTAEKNVLPVKPGENAGQKVKDFLGQA